VFRERELLRVLSDEGMDEVNLLKGLQEGREEGRSGEVICLSWAAGE